MSGDAALGEEEARQLHRVCGMLRSPSWTIRVAALAALQEFGRAAAPAADEISRLLEDPEGKVRQAARSCLVEIAPPDTGQCYVDRMWAPRPLVASVPSVELAPAAVAVNVRSILEDLEVPTLTPTLIALAC